MNRRAFIAALGGAAAWPLVARGDVTGLSKMTPELTAKRLERRDFAHPSRMCDTAESTEPA